MKTVILSRLYHLPGCPRCCLKPCLQCWSRQPFLCRCPIGQSSPDPDPLRSRPPLQTPTSGYPPASSDDQNTDISKGIKLGWWEYFSQVAGFVCMDHNVFHVRGNLCDRTGVHCCVMVCGQWYDCVQRSDHIRGLAAVYWLHEGYTSFTLYGLYSPRLLFR